MTQENKNQLLTCISTFNFTSKSVRKRQIFLSKLSLRKNGSKNILFWIHYYTTVTDFPKHTIACNESWKKE